MSTPLDLSGVLASTGSKLVACLTFPSGLSAGTGTTLTGGTVSGTTTISPAATQIFVGMSESPSGSGQYSVSSDIAGTLLPDTTTRPYTIEARIVASGTDMTTYSVIASAFAASTSEAYTVGPYPYGGGFLKSGGWGGSLPSGNVIITAGAGANQLSVTNGMANSVNVMQWFNNAVSVDGQQYPAVGVVAYGGHFVTDPAGYPNVVVQTNNDKTGYGLAANGLDAILIESGITASAALVNDASAQLTSINLRQAIALNLAAAAGITTGAGSANFAIHAGGLTGKTRINATTDLVGDRSGLTLTVPT